METGVLNQDMQGETGTGITGGRQDMDQKKTEDKQKKNSAL